eukprot:TRINITY_DN1394_c0_g1_i1.p1 TRINITY_DN1394_c0_g1~~TRINITY_DN1394_c0_g1_i1.p1  ORF type:complete len:104 (+),score=46.37 TRINITY_DN1394_c0_g1_i1:54-365(+)
MQQIKIEEDWWDNNYPLNESFTQFQSSQPNENKLFEQFEQFEQQSKQTLNQNDNTTTLSNEKINEIKEIMKNIKVNIPSNHWLSNINEEQWDHYTNKLIKNRK